MYNQKNNPYIKRPLVMGTLFYIVGLIGGKQQYDLWLLSFFFLIMVMAVMGMYQYYRSVYVGLYLLITCVGFGTMILNPILRDDNEFSKNQGAKIWVEGEVLEVKVYPYQNQYIIKPINVLIEGVQKKTTSLIQLDVKKEFQTVNQGDIIKASGIIEPLSFPRNPGSFNERKYLLIRKVTSKIKVKTLVVEQATSEIPWAQRLSQYYAKMFESLMPWEEAQIMKAMLIGDKTLLTQEIQSLYKDAGIAHVLAISGLHISVIGGVLWWILKKARLYKHLQGIIVMMVMWTYAAMTGFSISITRAVIMTTTILLGSLLEEKSDPLTSWSFAALILLMYNNLYLWDVGFQLSFVAVGSLILLTPFFNKMFFVPGKIRKQITPLIAVTVGTTPLIAYYYYVISPIGIVTNLLLVPLIAIVVTVGFLTMLIFPIHAVAGQWVIGSSYYLLVMIEKASKMALGIPFSTLIVGQPSRFELLLYVLLWGNLLWYLNLSLEQRKCAKKQVVIAGMLFGMMLWVKEGMPQNLEVTFLDVGQGDSAVIITPNHGTFIIDGGETGNGKKIEMFLKYKGIRKVDAMILSHAHTDHMNGLKELAMTYTVDKVFLTEMPVEEVAFREFYETMKSKDIPIYNIGAGDVIRHENVILEAVYPFKEASPVSGNDVSSVLVLTYGDVSYYFTGDIEENYEKQVAPFLIKNTMNILKVPHHGSKTSSAQELLTQVKPDIGIVSCGKNNLYQHPHEEVVRRYEQNNIPLLVTKNVGAVMTKSNGKKVKLYTMEDNRMLWK